MTDEGQNLTPAKPVAPRRRLPANPRMAQPMQRPLQPASDVEAEEDAREATAQVDETPPVVETPLVVETPQVMAPEAEPEPEAAQVAEPEPAQVPGPVPQPVVQPPAEVATPAAETPDFDFPRTIRETLRQVDIAWAAFRAAAMRFPSERMDERLGEDAWTRKQMLEHVAAWHDLTADRLVKLINTGAPAPLDRDTDQFNAAVARRAIGKTSGEVLKDMDATFNRLRRQMARLTDAQLQVGEWWAAYIIGGNTYGHYGEHWAEIYTPDLPPGSRSRR